MSETSEQSEYRRTRDSLDVTHKSRYRIISGRWLAVLITVFVAGMILRTVSSNASVPLLSNLLPWIDPPTVVLYFPDKDGRFLVPITREVDAESMSAVDIIKEYFAGPKDTDNLSTGLAGGAWLENVELRSTVAVVNVGSTPATSDQMGNLAAEALFRSLVSIPEITQVEVRSQGNRIGSSETQETATETRSIYRSYGDYLIPIAVEANNPRDSVDLFLGDKGANEPFVGLPDDVGLLDYRYEQKPKIVYLNLTYTESIRRMATDDPILMRRVLTGLIATLTDFPEVLAVMLDFEGHSRLGLGQCSDLLKAPQISPEALNEELDIRVF